MIQHFIILDDFFNSLLWMIMNMALSTTGLVNTHVTFVFRYGKYLMY